MRERPAWSGLTGWVALCALAESVGMTASAGASGAGQELADRPVALALVVAGGLVEGTALGLAQAWLLGLRFPALSRARYVVATVLVAGLGWAAASAPAVLAGDGSGSAPPLALVLLGAAGLGLAMGAALGLVQALALRGTVARPWRWVSANAVAWPGAMVLIFVGATTPDGGSSLGRLLLLGAVSGAAAGALLGLVLGRFAPGLGPPEGMPGASPTLSRLTLQSRE